MLEKSRNEAKPTSNIGNELLLVNKTNIALTLIEGQIARETISFTNPTANPIRMCFSECPFRVRSEKMLGFVLAEQLEVVITPWDRV